MFFSKAKTNSQFSSVPLFVFLSKTKQIKMKTLKIILALFVFSVSAELKEGGQFINYAHGISGNVYLKDEKTLVIKDFTYDGYGSKPLFWVGNTPMPTIRSNGTIFPFPISRRFNGETIELNLPENFKHKYLKFMAVWSRHYDMNYGDLCFSSAFSSASIYFFHPLFFLLIVLMVI